MPDYDDDTLEKGYKQALSEAKPVLAGWSPGDEDIPLPGELRDSDREMAAKYWRNPPAKRVKKEDELLEFPIYFAKNRNRRSRTRNYHFRRYDQVRAVGIGVENSNFVLATKEFTVYRANNIWKLLWVYLKHKVRNWIPKRKKKAFKLPSYY